MPKDKYTAVWVSHSSISDYLECSRAYYLKNIYKDPKTGNKIQIISPPLALGQAVHEVLESLSKLPKEERFSESLITKLDKAWQNVSGQKGGFLNEESEYRYKKRGEAMLARVYKNPGPLKNLAVKISKDLPWFWLSEQDNIILCGRIDWLEYLPESDSVHIIDFKTGKRREGDGSLQLPIYYLLAQNCQKRPVARASYWYLETDNRPSEADLPNPKEARDQLLGIARKIKLARQLKKFDCKEGGCRACDKYEQIIKGAGKLVNTSQFGADVYVPKVAPVSIQDEDSVIL
jgi:ATP-dependent helicase/DNAse subunit B